MPEQTEVDLDKLPWRALGFMKAAMLDDAEPHLQFAHSANTDSATGPTIVFLHGVLRDWRTFYPLFIGLHGKAKLVSIDFRGHGGSQATPKGYRVIDYVEDAVRVIQSLPGQIVLYGHSLGAMVALATAAKIPDRIHLAILEDPPFSTMGARLSALPLKQYFQGVERIALAEAGNEVVLMQNEASREAKISRLFEAFSNLVVEERPDGSVVRVRDQRDATSRRFSAECLANVDPKVLLSINTGHWMDDYDLKSLLPTIKSPLILLRADSACGGMLTNEEADWLTAKLANRCQQIYYPGVGHTIHWAKPQEIVELLVSRK